MEIIEFKGINDSLNTWIEKKKEFKEIIEYNDKLEWWKKHFKFGTAQLVLQLIGPPKDRNFILSVLRYGIDKKSRGIITIKEECPYQEFISVLPQKEEDLILFWNWMFQLFEFPDFTYWKVVYTERIEKMNHIDFNSDKSLFFEELNQLKEYYSNDIYFESGCKAATLNDFECSSFFVSEYRFVECITLPIQLFLRGYEYKLREFALKESLEKHESTLKEIPKHEPSIKLKWNGPSKVLHDIFAQCLNKYNKSGRPYLDSTTENIAEFIIQHFEGITANKKTISTEIGKIKTEQLTPPKEETRIIVKD